MVASITSGLSQVGSYIPSIVGALIILIIGGLIAKLLEMIVVRVLKSIQLDKAAETLKVNESLAKGNVKMTFTELLGALIYWICMIIVLIAGIKALGLDVTSQALNRVLTYIPSVVAAAFILVLGAVVSNFVAGAVRIITSNIGLSQSKMIGNFTQYAIIIFAIIVALQGLLNTEGLAISASIVKPGLGILFAGICLGLAIAFGFGARDLASDIINKLRSKE
jgi:hypothetical protein